MIDGDSRQIPFGLEPPSPRRSRKDFVTAASNVEVLAMLDRWRMSNEPLLVITGPPASGKTHLLQILADAARGEIGIVDDADRLSDPRRLLLMIEQARESGARLAIAGRGDPGDWAQGLRDLRSRLFAAARIGLAEPDDVLMQAVILKLLKDRQLRAGPEIAAYAAARLPGTFAAAESFVAAIDAASIAAAAPVGVKLARIVIANLSEEPRPA